MDGTYCSKSVNRQCIHTHCPRNLNGFYGMYVRLKEFNCEEVLNEQTANNTNKETEHGC